MNYVSKSLGETQRIAQEFAASLKTGERAAVVALDGELGSGKTAFVQFVGEALGIHEPMQSPTFLIEKIYSLQGKPWQRLIHIDAYRLEHEGELESLGWQEMVSKPENLIFIEWAEKVRPILPKDAIHIVFNHVRESEREISIA